MPYLNFKGKTAVETYHHTLAHHTFELASDLSVLEPDQEPSLDGNLIIEGDNLLALKALLPTHKGRIKCIYIDPPYNTGNEGWVYNDNLTQPQFKAWIGQTVGNDEKDPNRHDKWCCMMYPRLKLLWELLRADGVIFVSVDDNEAHHLRMLLDEIFGGNNFIANVIWQKKYAVSSDAKGIPALHDHILVYSRNESFVPNLLSRTEKQDAAYKNPDKDPRGLWRPDNILRNEYRERDQFPITSPAGNVFYPPAGTSWRHPQNVIEEMIKDNRIWFGKDGQGRPSPKRFLAEVRQGIVASAWWTFNEVGHNDESKKELQKIFPEEEVFATPKPTRLIQRVLEIATKTSEDDIVLDSFSGSGTTAHAVLQMNNEDDGNRRFILIQQPFDSKIDEGQNRNIAETVTRERVRRAIKGINTEPLGGSFTYARLSDAPLLGEYRDLGENPPPYEEIAKYIFFTETSRNFSLASVDKSTGKIGEHNGESYYLLYTPNAEEDCALDTAFLENVAEKDPNKKIVVYCEKIWLHRNDRLLWEDRTEKSVRPMLVPFHLK